MDGTLGSQTALMLDGSGVQITSGEELAEIVLAGAAAGFPVAVHAIGDGANREALDAFERTRRVWAPLGLRHRIEHAQLLAPEDLPRFAALGVACSVQFSHAPSDRDLADRFWAGKIDGAYAYRSLVDSGAVVANGSDAPIEELDPLAGIRAGVRRTIDERGRLASGAGGDGRSRRSRRRASRRRGSTGEERRRGGCSPATPPTSSCSTATRGTTSTPRSSRRWSPAAGCTTRRPGTDRSLCLPPYRRAYAALARGEPVAAVRPELVREHGPGSATRPRVDAISERRSRAVA